MKKYFSLKRVAYLCVWLVIFFVLPPLMVYLELIPEQASFIVYLLILTFLFVLLFDKRSFQIGVSLAILLAIFWLYKPPFLSLLIEGLNNRVQDAFFQIRGPKKNTGQIVIVDIDKRSLDTVRMLRLLKFRARFKFKICPITLKALDKCQEEILKSAPARLLEETLRMLESGASEPFFRLMLKHRFLDILFPWLTHFLQGPSQDNVFKLLKQADTYNKKQIRHNRPTTSRNSLFACFIFPILQKEISHRVLLKS